MGRYAPPDQQRIVDLYDGTVRYTDAAIGELLRALRARGVLDNTLVIITADHGEEFWDHGTFFHAQSLYSEQLHVPLVIRLPGGKAAGTIIQRSVRLVDILPTIATVLGLAPVPDGDGTSLVGPDLDPQLAHDREVFARAANPRFPHRFALQSGTHKLIVTVADGGEELYDLSRDPQSVQKDDMFGGALETWRRCS